MLREQSLVISQKCGQRQMALILQQKLKLLLQSQKIPLQYLVLLKQMSHSLSPWQMNQFYSYQINLLITNTSPSQIINNLLSQRSNVIKQLKSLLIKQKSQKQFINLSYVCQKIQQVRYIGLRIIQGLIRCKDGSNRRNFYAHQILKNINNDLQFLKLTPIRKYIQFATNDPLFIVSMHKFWKLNLSSNYNSRPIIDLFQVDDQFKQRLEKADKFFKKINALQSIKISKKSTNKLQQQQFNNKKELQSLQKIIILPQIKQQQKRLSSQNIRQVQKSLPEVVPATSTQPKIRNHSRIIHQKGIKQRSITLDTQFNDSANKQENKKYSQSNGKANNQLLYPLSQQHQQHKKFSQNVRTYIQQQKLLNSVPIKFDKLNPIQKNYLVEQRSADNKINKISNKIKKDQKQLNHSIRIPLLKTLEQHSSSKKTVKMSDRQRNQVNTNYRQKQVDNKIQSIINPLQQSPKRLTINQLKKKHNHPKKSSLINQMNKYYQTQTQQYEQQQMKVDKVNNMDRKLSNRLNQNHTNKLMDRLRQYQLLNSKQKDANNYKQQKSQKHKQQTQDIKKLTLNEMFNQNNGKFTKRTQKSHNLSQSNHQKQIQPNIQRSLDRKNIKSFKQQQNLNQIQINNNIQRNSNSKPSNKGSSTNKDKINKNYPNENIIITSFTVNNQTQKPIISKNNIQEEYSQQQFQQLKGNISQLNIDYQQQLNKQIKQQSQIQTKRTLVIVNIDQNQNHCHSNNQKHQINNIGHQHQHQHQIIEQYSNHQPYNKLQSIKEYRKYQGYLEFENNKKQKIDQQKLQKIKKQQNNINEKQNKQDYFRQKDSKFIIFQSQDLQQDKHAAAMLPTNNIKEVKENIQYPKKIQRFQTAQTQKTNFIKLQNSREIQKAGKIQNLKQVQARQTKQTKQTQISKNQQKPKQLQKHKVFQGLKQKQKLKDIQKPKNVQKNQQIVQPKQIQIPIQNQQSNRFQKYKESQNCYNSKPIKQAQKPQNIQKMKKLQKLTQAQKSKQVLQTKQIQTKKQILPKQIQAIKTIQKPKQLQQTKLIQSLKQQSKPSKPQQKSTSQQKPFQINLQHINHQKIQTLNKVNPQLTILNQQKQNPLRSLSTIQKCEQSPNDKTSNENKIANNENEGKDLKAQIKHNMELKQVKEKTALLNTNEVIDLRSKVTIPNLTKCIYQSKSLSNSQLCGFLQKQKIDPSIIQSLNSEKKGYFSNRHLCLNICWLNNQMISFSLSHPSHILSQPVQILVLFKVIDPKYYSQCYRLTVTTIKYLFFNDPIGRIVYLRPVKQFFDQTQIQIDMAISQFKNVKAKINANPYNTLNTTKVFDQNALIIDRLEWPCKNSQSYLNAIQFHVVIVSALSQYKISSVFKQSKIRLSSTYLKQINNDLKNISIKTTKKLKSKQQVMQLLQEEEYHSLKIETKNISKECNQFLVYERVFSGFDKKVKFTSYCGVFYFLVQESSNSIFYWQKQNIGYLFIKCQENEQKRKNQQQNNNSQERGQHYFMLMDYIYQSQVAIDSKRYLPYIQSEASNIILSTPSKFSNRIVTIPCFSSQTVTNEFNQNNFISSINMNLNWNNYIKGVRTINDQLIVGEFIAPFWFGIVQSRNHRISVVCGGHIAEHQEQLTD